MLYSYDLSALKSLPDMGWRQFLRAPESAVHLALHLSVKEGKAMYGEAYVLLKAFTIVLMGLLTGIAILHVIGRLFFSGSTRLTGARDGSPEESAASEEQQKGSPCLATPYWLEQKGLPCVCKETHHSVSPRLRLRPWGFGRRKRAAATTPVTG